jgi:indolepyruvate ferredoxin oxidoreductase beta subunit
MELLESLRYTEFLAPDGAIVTASEPVVNIENYPDSEAVIAQIKRFSASRIVEASPLPNKRETPALSTW